MNNRKGFANIVLIVIIVAIVAVGGYFVFSKKSVTPTPSQQNPEAGATNEPNQGQGASFVPEQDRIQITSPKGGEKLEVGKTYDIHWTNYSGKEPLTIALQVTTPSNQVSAKIVASNVPAASTGTYKWTVTSESSENKYKVEVYPAGGRELVGRSKDFFTISGEQLITITSPKPNDRVNLTQPIIIIGKARKVFGEGEFDISASYLLDNQKKVVARALATCNIAGNGCDWTSGNFVDFKSTLDLSSAPVCYVSVEFYKRDDKTPQTKPFYVLPLYLFGNENCQ
ncbi:MAG: Ser-Thr-rich GPI-anchored membrane family protein [Patescibacteria group bacterium]